MTAVRPEQHFCSHVQHCSVVPPHPSGWQETCMDIQLIVALASRGEEEQGCLFVPLASLLKLHLPYSVNLLSHFETKTIGFPTSHKLMLLAKGREYSFNARVTRCACLYVHVYACLFQI